jgi:hypothetical protein
MKKVVVFILFFLAYPTFSQVGIGTTNPINSAALDVTSTSSGVLIPRMTLAQKNAIVSPATGLLIYQNDGVSGFWCFNGTVWTTFSDTSWLTLGNSGTSPATNYLGTNDSKELIVKTNNTEALRVNTNSNVGIGTSSIPTTKLFINNSGGAIRLEDGTQAAGNILTSDANGNVSWEDPTMIGLPDDDWRFNSGSDDAAPIYRTGSVKIGPVAAIRYTSPDALLDVYNNTTKQTEFGIGDVEYEIDWENLFQFSHSLIPSIDNSYTLGKSDRKWHTVFATNGTINTSDIRDKENIIPIKYGLKELMKLRPVSYYWKEEKYGNTVLEDKDKKRKIGFIAQELMKVLPETVHDKEWQIKDPNNPTGDYVLKPTESLGVSYSEILPIVVKATQEHQSALDEIRNEQKRIVEKVKSLTK